MADKFLCRQCSNCGKRITIEYEMPGKLYKRGYRAVGDVIYCPKCVRSWADRNGKSFDEQFKESRQMFLNWILNTIIKDRRDNDA